jgi:hypothetical protein
MAEKFEVAQAEKSFLKVRHPVEGLTFTFPVVEGQAPHQIAFRLAAYFLPLLRSSSSS